MTTLLSLVEVLEPGDKLLWIGEEGLKNAGDRAYPKTVTNIERHEDMILVEGEGIRGGEYYFEVTNDGESEAFFVNPDKHEPVSMGSVAVARLTDSDELVQVKPVIDDIRGE